MRQGSFTGPEIWPLSGGEARPFWSVMIPIYNRVEFVEQVLEAVLRQAPGPERMQIEVVDDCSANTGIEELVRRIGGGRVAFFRQPKNLGIMGNLNSCVNRARGRWVHLIPDDDLVLPGFYAAMDEGVRSAPQTGAWFCRHRIVDAENRERICMELERFTPGILENWVEIIATTVRVQIPAIVVRRDVYEDLGGFRPEIGSAADWEMWKRIAAHYPTFYDPRILANYRSHGSSQSAQLDRSGEGMASMRKAIDAAHPYLPAERAALLTGVAREMHAVAAVINASQALVRGDAETAVNQTREAMLLSQSPKIVNLIQTRLVPEFSRLGVSVQWGSGSTTQTGPANL